MTEVAGVRTLVISPGSAEKRDQVLNPARAADLANSLRRRQSEERLAAFACPAIAMYASAHHRLVVEGMRAVWERWGPSTWELYILSAGYGLLPADEVIVPYDAAFGEEEPGTTPSLAAPSALHQQASRLVGEYDLVFFLLSGPALEALRLPLDVDRPVQQIILTDQQSLLRLPGARNLHAVVAAGNVAARRWHVPAPQVCGFLFHRLCEQIVRKGPAVLEWLYRQPQDVEQLFYKRAQWRPQLPLWAA